MSSKPLILAIETSTAHGSVALGRGDALLAAEPLPRQRRHNVELMAVVQQLFKDHHLAARDLDCVAVSTGPGSFTGLRVGIATAKMLAMALGAAVAAVPTIEAASRNAPAPRQNEPLAVGINLKRETLYSARFAWDGMRWQIEGDAALRTIGELLGELGRPAMLLGDPLPELTGAQRQGVTVLDPALANPRAPVVLEIGRQMFNAGRTTPADELLPHYARRPEAQVLWEQRQG